MTHTSKVDPADFTRFSPVPQEARAALDDLFESGELFRYAGDPATSPASLLEVEFARYVGMKYAIGVNSCSSGILLALRLCGVERGDRVFVPAFTFTAVPSAVVHAGAEPILIETTADYRMDVADFERKAHRAKVLLLSHMRGYMSDLDAVASICAAHGIVMIEDAAHALGSYWRGRSVGSFGKIGCFSFQSNKIINAGEGGMIVTDDEEIAAQAVILSGAYENLYRYHHGIDRGHFDRFKKLLPLFNMRLTNIAAAIARPQLRTVDARAEKYRQLHGSLVSKLQVASNLLAFPQTNPREVRVPDSLQFRVPGFGPDQMRTFLAAAKKAGLPLSGIGIDPDNARMFQNWNYLPHHHDMEVTRTILATACDMRLPPDLTEAHLNYAADAIAKAARIAETA